MINILMITSKQKNALLELIRRIRVGYQTFDSSVIAVKRIEEALDDNDGARAYSIIGLWNLHGEDKLIHEYHNKL